MKIRFIAAGLIFIFHGAFAGKTQNWIINSYSDFTPGKFENVLLNYNGTISVSREINKLLQMNVVYGWRMVECRGKYYISSASPAAVFACNGNGSDLDTVVQYESGGVFGICTDGKDVYAAVSPRGEILRIRGNEAEIIFKRDSMSVWDMICVENGKLALATSTGGKIFLLSVEGILLDSVETGDKAAVCLAVSGDTLYAGTSGKGFLFAYSLSSATAYAAADPEGSEVNSICTFGNFIVYSSISGNIDITGLTSLRLTVDPYFNVPPSSAEIVSRVFKYQDGRSEALFASPNPPVTSLFWISEKEICAIGSPDGTVLIFDTEKNELSSFRAPEERIFTAWAGSVHSGPMLLGTNPLTLFRMSQNRSGEGIYTTQTLDAGDFPVWGEFLWTGEGNVRIQARTGNTASPDAMWSDWTRETTDFGSVKDELPPGERIQFRVLFDGYVEKFEFLYSSGNRKPELQRPVVFAPGSASYGVSQTVPELRVNSLGDAERRMMNLGGWQTPQNPVSIQPTHQGVSFEASDPDGDSITYEVFIRDKNRTDWMKIGWQLKEKHFAFNRLFFADGEYILRVIASDSLSNSAGSFLCDTAFTETFTIDNTGPQIVSFSTSATAANFSAADSRSRIVNVSFSFDGINWTEVEPEDGVFDSKTENFHVTLTGVADRVIMIKAIDSHFNQSYAYFGL
ncbi:hypothetical protein JXL83_04560 [candidate division WOR-3 bacterium]|nr:hypothetical protein [candidate division WOR-3 bacterium]